MSADHLAAPTPLPEHHRLAVFAGEWAGDEVVHPSRWTAGGPAISQAIARIDLNGFFLIQDTRRTRDGKEAFASHSYSMKIQFSPDAEGWADVLTGVYRRIH